MEIALPGMKIMERQIQHLLKQLLVLEPMEQMMFDVADIDGDGDLDIISASGNDDEITWFENNGAADPTFATTVIATSADNPHEVFIADMDSDGDLDIVSTSVNDSTVAWYENNGAADPTFAAADIATNVSGPHGIHVDDMDADGDMDIVIASFTDDTVRWYETMEQQIQHGQLLILNIN